ncbi:hypothetical protein AMS68_000605 [Peltaster fructicola]|uniref:Core domain-containing protein n=1 Tax=Peltaster fructicola TaxID=286661 RepID=A0A6H0XKC6_9PEZI|nr:hypothetical protein AMS68_000605 [Peltaster fructicola]
MSTSKAFVPVFQAARRTIRHASPLKLHQRALSSTSSTTAPLYLDFLAPHWQAQPRRQHLHAPTRCIHASHTRGFSSTSTRPATAIANPRKDDDGNDMSITITPRAEHRLKAIAEKDGNHDLALRVSVESGGCHGFQYLMKLINTSDVDQDDDTIFVNEEAAGKYSARVVMDEPSLELLKGSSVDYTMELIGSQFTVTGIPGAKSSCGCGTSFDIAQ